ncbi:GNAT family N-acetyltransferase [Streptomyces puniciscabiei]
MTPVLRTERLEFLPYRAEDEDAFVRLLRNEEVCRWMGQELVPEPDLRALFRAILTEVYPERRFDVWGLWLDGAYAGHAEVKKTGNVPGHELVTALAPEYWGHGLGGEVVQGLLRHAADHLGLTEAYGMVGAENTASLAMCRRLGFRHLRDVVADDGTVTRMLVIPTPATNQAARPGPPAPADPAAPADAVHRASAFEAYPAGAPGLAAAFAAQAGGTPPVTSGAAPVSPSAAPPGSCAPASDASPAAGSGPATDTTGIEGPA